VAKATLTSAMLAIHLEAQREIEQLTPEQGAYRIKLMLQAHPCKRDEVGLTEFMKFPGGLNLRRCSFSRCVVSEVIVARTDTNVLVERSSSSVAGSTSASINVLSGSHGS
jgi:hypothetical protein